MCSGMMRVVAMMESSLHNKTACIRRPLVSFYSPFLYRMTGICLTFFPMVRRSNAKTISLVRSKNPMSFFQLIPHLQCCKPI